MWTMFISNETALRATQVAKSSVFWVKSFQSLGLFHWAYVKDKVYADAPQLIQELKEKIRAVIDEIQSQMCENY